MKPSVIVWDLETVPDLGGFAAANDLAALRRQLRTKSCAVFAAAIALTRLTPETLRPR